MARKLYKAAVEEEPYVYEGYIPGYYWNRRPPRDPNEIPEKYFREHFDYQLFLPALIYAPQARSLALKIKWPEFISEILKSKPVKWTANAMAIAGVGGDMATHEHVHTLPHKIPGIPFERPRDEIKEINVELPNPSIISGPDLTKVFEEALNKALSQPQNQLPNQPQSQFPPLTNSPQPPYFKLKVVPAPQKNY